MQRSDSRSDEELLKLDEPRSSGPLTFAESTDRDEQLALDEVES
jgi:hypothetical protein